MQFNVITVLIRLLYKVYEGNQCVYNIDISCPIHNKNISGIYDMIV